MRCHDVNVRLVHASQPIGRLDLSKMRGIMNLPKPVTKKPYNEIQKKIAENSIKQAKKLMKNSTKRLYELTEIENPENILITEDNEKFANVAVTVDGTWMKRGHQSKSGVVFVQSVRTGEVLDYAVKSLYCHKCARQKNKLSKEESEIWSEDHKDSCQINHKGSSDKMESEGANEIFLCSMHNNLIYKIFVGYGDSGCFGNVKEACDNKYGDSYSTIKEDDVQKRIGTRLREYKKKMRGTKLKDGLTVGGKNRLTDKVIDKIQNYYGQAIRGNIGDKEGMKKDIWAIFEHCIRDESAPLDQQHTFCPKDGWCWYWSNRAEYNDTKQLPPVLKDELRPIFKSLTDDALLDQCLMGLTQNQNECINSVLWSRCPKIKFVGRQKLELTVSDTVSVFNSSAGKNQEKIKQHLMFRKLIQKK